MPPLHRTVLIQLGVFTSHPAAIVIVALYLAAWLILDRVSFDWHAVATVTLGQVSPHLVHSGETHESQAMNARPSRARAAASQSLGSASRIPTTTRRSLSAAAWASTDGTGAGSPHVPGGGPGASCGGR